LLAFLRVVLEDVRFLYGVFVVMLWWMRGELWSVDDLFEIFLQLFRFGRFTVPTHDVANCVAGKVLRLRLSRSARELRHLVLD
jgi:hypothetical protein